MIEGISLIFSWNFFYRKEIFLYFSISTFRDDDNQEVQKMAILGDFQGITGVKKGERVFKNGKLG